MTAPSTDDALEVLRFERESFAALARLSPEQLAEMQAEAQELTEVGVEVRE